MYANDYYAALPIQSNLLPLSIVLVNVECPSRTPFEEASSQRSEVVAHACERRESLKVVGTNLTDLRSSQTRVAPFSTAGWRTVGW